MLTPHPAHPASPRSPGRPPNRRGSRGLRLVVTLVTATLLVSGFAGCVPEPPGPDRPGGDTRPPPRSAGLWISPAEVASLPTSGPAWNRLVAVAHGGWGTPSLADNDASHDTATLAGALVAVRTGDRALTDCVRNEIAAVTRTTRFARVLELSRNITSYVIAADLVGLSAPQDQAFRRFVAELRHRPLRGHSGGTDLTSTALRSPNNWGTMARAAVVAIDLYLGDRAHLAPVATAHRAWLGERVANQLRYSDTGWHATSPPAGVNPPGARIGGHSVDGLLPEDQRRTGEPSTGAPPRGSYPWEALQGALVTGVLLHRAGVVGIGAGRGALARAAGWLTHVNRNPATGDDTWQPWVLNRVAGTSLPTTEARSPGKNMGWSDWTHGPRS